MKKAEIKKIVENYVAAGMFYGANENGSEEYAIDAGLFEKHGVAYKLATIVNDSPFYTADEAEEHGADEGDLKAYVGITANPDKSDVRVFVDIGSAHESFYTVEEFAEKYGE